MPEPTSPPSVYPDWATKNREGDDGQNSKVAPSVSKRASGWEYREFPPYNWFNWWMNLVGRWFRHHTSRIDDIDSRINQVESTTVPLATEEQAGVVEYASPQETIAGQRTDRAIHPAGLRAAISQGIATDLIFESKQNLQTKNHVSDKRYEPTSEENYYDVFPPTGATIQSLLAFMPSVSWVRFSGDVNGDDKFFCRWELRQDRIRVWAGNSETREPSELNYISIWGRVN